MKAVKNFTVVTFTWSSLIGYTQHRPLRSFWDENLHSLLHPMGSSVNSVISEEVRKLCMGFITVVWEKKYFETLKKIHTFPSKIILFKLLKFIDFKKVHMVKTHFMLENLWISEPSLSMLDKLYWLFLYASKYIFSSTTIVKSRIDWYTQKQIEFTEPPAWYLGSCNIQTKVRDVRSRIKSKSATK